MGFLSNKIWVRIFLGHPVFVNFIINQVDVERKNHHSHEGEEPTLKNFFFPFIFLSSRELANVLIF